MSIASYMLATSSRLPAATALVDEFHELTFLELRERALTQASRLIERGVRKGDVVAILIDRSCDMITAMHAVLLCGAIYCPLDTKSPLARLHAMLDRLEPKLLLHDGRQSFELAGRDVPCMLFSEKANSTRGALDEIEKRLASTSPTDPCYVIFTSGSTGEPKGVTVSHGSVLNYIEWAIKYTRLTEADRIAGQAPFHFDNSVLDVYLAMATGATLDIFPSHLFAFPRRLAEYLSVRNITFVFWVPSAMSSVAVAPPFETNPPRSLRHVAFAGEVMPPSTLSRWMEALPDAQFSNLYGPTEITVDCTWYSVPPAYAGERVPIGFPLPGTEIILVDEDDAPCVEGAVGEMLVRGAGVALGYWNRPDLTKSAFIQNPLHDRYMDRTYRTGDLAYRDEAGCLHFVGRRDNQVKRRGYRIELGDIEHALEGVPSLVSAAVVFDSPRDRLVLFAVLTQPASLIDIRKLLKDKLPGYMLPDALVTMDSLPTNASGKIDRKHLMASLEAHND